MENQSIDYDYDRENDILYLSLGTSVNSYGDDLCEGIIARYNMSTDELTGVTIIGFTERYRNNHQCLSNIPMDVDFDNIFVKCFYALPVS